MADTNLSRLIAEAQRLAAEIPHGKLRIVADGLLKNEAGQYVGPHRVCIEETGANGYCIASTGDARNADSHAHAKLIVDALRLVKKLAAQGGTTP